MFGYIRPVTTELKVKELDAFKACYCGLCHVLGKQYGFLSRFILNYDFVYLTMLLWDKDTPVEFEGKRCAACPHKKKKCCKQNGAFEKAAALSLILYWWKIQDEIQDESFFKSLLYRFVSACFKNAYKKAALLYSDFDVAVRDNLEALSALEKENCTSMDASADCFAKILSAAAVSENPQKERILQQVLYHTGRWIYIIDAADDLGDDVKNRRYNPVAARFDCVNGLNRDTTDQLKVTLMHSRNLAGNAFELLDETPWSDTVRNIIALGMPGVTEAVLSGAWKNRKRLNKLKDWK